MKKVFKNSQERSHMKMVLCRFAECKNEPDDQFANDVEAYLFCDEKFDSLPSLQKHKETLTYLISIKEMYCLKTAEDMYSYFAVLQQDLDIVVAKYETGDILEKIAIEEALHEVNRIDADADVFCKSRKSQLRTIARHDEKAVADSKEQATQKQSAKRQLTLQLDAED